MKRISVFIKTTEQAQRELNFMFRIATSPNVNAEDLHNMWTELHREYRKYNVNFVQDSIEREPKKTARTLWDQIHGGKVRFNV